MLELGKDAVLYSMIRLISLGCFLLLSHPFFDEIVIRWVLKYEHVTMTHGTNLEASCDGK